MRSVQGVPPVQVAVASCHLLCHCLICQRPGQRCTPSKRWRGSRSSALLDTSHSSTPQGRAGGGGGVLYGDGNRQPPMAGAAQPFDPL